MIARFRMLAKWTHFRVRLAKVCHAGLYVLFVLCLTLNIAYAKSAQLIHGKGVSKGENIHQKLIPASVQKVITMYLAWNILGPNYRYHTTLLQIHSNKSYQIVFTFDPTFKEKDLEALIQHLPKHTKINVELVSNGLTQPQNPLWEKAQDLNRVLYGLQSWDHQQYARYRPFIDDILKKLYNKYKWDWDDFELSLIGKDRKKEEIKK